MIREIINEIERIALKIVVNENEELTALFKNGIFLMPELAYNFKLQKELCRCLKIVNGITRVQISREKNLINKDLTDIFLSVNETTNIAIEIKLDNTYDAYLEDIIKLSNIPNDLNCSKIFIGIKHVLNLNQGNEFTNMLETKLKIRNIKYQLTQKEYDTFVSNKKGCLLFLFIEVI